MKRIVAAVSLILWLGPAWTAAGGDKPTKTSSDEALEPWASRCHPKDAARRHTQEITAAKQEYRVTQGGTMDGTNCRSPIGVGIAHIARRHRTPPERAKGSIDGIL